MAGFDACAERIPDGAVWACAPPSGTKDPAKIANAAAVTIRFITSTQSLLSGHTVSDCRAKVNRAQGSNKRSKPVGEVQEHALNRRNVEGSKSTVARRHGSHGA